MVLRNVRRPGDSGPPNKPYLERAGAQALVNVAAAKAGRSAPSRYPDAGMTNALGRRILGTAVVVLSAAIWSYGLQWSALLNLVTGPLNGFLSARAAVLLRGMSGAGRTRLLALGLYGAVLAVAAAALAGGVVPIAANGLQPSFSTVFLGVHGEGLLGLLGLLAGAAVALLAFRAHLVAG